mmetsp:Transcript_21395/g.44740  ORF Transcript_21395/g.44740 Transcript_21395/m.44740 type:complete len:356 (-) Transcript_21395:1683-2750(-)
MDASLTAQTYFVILLLCKFLFIHFFQLFDFSISILLQLCQRFLMMLEGQLFLFDVPVHGLPVGTLDLLGVLFHLLNHCSMFRQQRTVLRIPFLLLPLQVGFKLLVALILQNHLLVERLLLFLKIPCMIFLQALHVLFIFHFHLSLLFPQHFELPSFRLYLFTVLLLHLRHLLLVQSISVSELEGDTRVQFFYSPFKFQECRLFLIQELSRHQDLVRISQAKVLLGLGGAKLFDVKDAQTAIIPCAKEVQLIPGDADPRNRSCMRLVLHVVASQREVITPQGPRHFRLCHASNQCTGAWRQCQLSQGGVGLQIVGQLALSNLLQHLVRSSHIQRGGLGGCFEVGQGHNTGKVGSLL